MSCAVLGLGSSHGDDQLGWQLVDQLDTCIDCINIRAPGAELYDVLQRYEHVVVVDASELGLSPGEYRLIEDGTEMLRAAQPHLSSHTLDLVQYWLLLETLQLPLPKVSLFLVQLKQCHALQGISPELQDRLQEYKDRLERYLNRSDLQ